MTTLKRLALVTGLVFVGFANSAPANAADCVKVAGQYFLDGSPVSSCPKAKAYRQGPWGHSAEEHPGCAGKPAGTELLGPGPDGRLARIRCK